MATINANDISKHAEVIASDGQTVGTEPYRVCRRPSFLRECPDEKSKIYP